MAAATEGHLFGIPAIAFSLTDRGWRHLDQAARVARRIVESVLARPPSTSPFLLNVNMPCVETLDQAPWRLTRLGRRHASFPAEPQRNPRGDLFYWIGSAGEAREDGDGTDFHAVKQGQVSITPLQVDMTDHARLPQWQGWLDRA
mgnify:FL=1